MAYTRGKMTLARDRLISAWRNNHPAFPRSERHECTDKCVTNRRPCYLSDKLSGIEHVVHQIQGIDEALKGYADKPYVAEIIGQQEFNDILVRLALMSKLADGLAWKY